MDTLAKYVKLFNDKHPKNKISVIGTPMAHYGDDVVTKALMAAMANGNTVERVKQLRNDQLQVWFDSHKSVDDVFNSLRLRNIGYGALSSPRLEVLEDYIRFVNKKKNGHESLINVFITGFGGEINLVPILRTAKMDSSTSAKAKKLVNSLLNRWLDSDYKPEHVFEVLSLGDDISRALYSANLGTLERYISAFNTKASEQQNVDVWDAHGALRRRCCVGGLEICHESTGHEEDGDKLGDDGFAFISSPKLDRLDDYIKFVNSKASGQTTLLQALKSGFGERELAVNLVQANTYARGSAGAKAKPLQEAQFTQWLDEGYDSISVLTKLFKVDETKLNTASMMGKTVAKQFKQFYEKANGVSTKVEPRRS
ncbi:hypothetical protein PF008_g24660 [Phytophthora fragariae]|uniref:RxLR effector protein n=1 Tax=Phytophthora fragariae TaxID=53985 RepID=A0A6G0QMV7_9STRA|nr:hypothetical protein PF008_g24660 [Phytophthora fragariae]